jgi:hypothetical protein
MGNNAIRGLVKAERLANEEQKVKCDAIANEEGDHCCTNQSPCRYGNSVLSDFRLLREYDKGKACNERRAQNLNNSLK